MLFGNFCYDYKLNLVKIFSRLALTTISVRVEIKFLASVPRPIILCLYSFVFINLGVNWHNIGSDMHSILYRGRFYPMQDTSTDDVKHKKQKSKLITILHYIYTNIVEDVAMICCRRFLHCIVPNHLRPGKDRTVANMNLSLFSEPKIASRIFLNRTVANINLSLFFEPKIASEYHHFCPRLLMASL